MSTYEIEEGNIIFRLDSILYDVDCVMKTAHLFLDRYYVYLTQEDQTIVVTLTPKKRGAEDEETQKVTFGEFCNELLNQVVHANKKDDKGLKNEV